MGNYLKKFDTHSNYEDFVAGGTMMKPNVSYCVQENEVHYNPYVHDYADDYLTFVALEDGTFQLSTNAVSYSLDDGETWTTLAAGTASPTVTTGNKILWKGELTPSSSYGIGTFSATGNFDVQGNAMSLLYGDNFNGKTDLTGKNYAFYQLFKDNTKVISVENLSLSATTLANDCYSSMFQGCTTLVNAPQLPATTLANNCYQYMFKGCTSLTTAPELPATILASNCYSQMFSGCISLREAPELPATTLANYCYYRMFYDCTSLITAPVLPATTLEFYCYGSMFQGCTALTTAPVLPAKTLTNYCYTSMFNGCTNLITVPELPATTLAQSCYYQMFQGCTSLTSAPELPATTLAQSCYQQMFLNCTNLNYIKAMFTTTPTSGNYTTNWVSRVASTGTFVKNSAATWANTFGDNSIPTGWTVQTASA